MRYVIFLFPYFACSAAMAMEMLPISFNAMTFVCEIKVNPKVTIRGNEDQLAAMDWKLIGDRQGRNAFVAYIGKDAVLRERFGEDSADKWPTCFPVNEGE